MNKDAANKKDKIRSGPSTTGSYGVSTSSNITIDSAGTVGDGSHSYFPEFDVDKKWTSSVNKGIGDSSYDEEDGKK